MNKSLTPAQLAAEARKIINSEIACGNESGCQLTVICCGKVVLDISCGVPDNALFPVFSAGKPFLAALALRLVQDGLLALDDPVGKYWQEFAAPDKRDITLAHLLSHRAGMFQLPLTNRREMANWQVMCRKTAAITPKTPAGKKCAYHPLTFAWLVGHTLELAAGRELPELMHSRIIAPLGLENEVYFGIDDDARTRFVPVDDRFAPVKPSWFSEMMNDPQLQRCCIPSFNCVASARGLARFYAGVRGKVLSPELFDFATGKLFRDPADPPRPDCWEKFALGFVLANENDPADVCCGHGGAVGSEGFYMPGREVAVGFTKNCFRSDYTVHPVRDRLSNLLQIPVRHW